MRAAVYARLSHKKDASEEGVNITDPATVSARMSDDRTLTTCSDSDEQPRGRVSGVLSTGRGITSREPTQRQTR